MSFKIGSKVKIKPHIAGHCGKTNCPTFEAYGMGKFVGKVAKITNNDSNFYKIDIDFSDWNWSDCMLESVEKPKLDPIYEDIARLKTIDRVFNGGNIRARVRLPLAIIHCNSCVKPIKAQYEVNYINGYRYRFIVNLSCGHIYTNKYDQLATIPTNKDFETLIRIFKTK